jgi:hypothetical protein
MLPVKWGEHVKDIKQRDANKAKGTKLEVKNHKKKRIRDTTSEQLRAGGQT